jgi:RNA polymerase sigma factor (sigma-70 family)
LERTEFDTRSWEALIVDRTTLNSPEFIARLRAGDLEAYVQLSLIAWNLLRPLYYRLNLQWLAEDLFSVTLLKLFRTKCAGYDSAKTLFSTWLITVGWRDAIDEWRRQQLHKEVPLEEADKETFPASENIGGRQELKQRAKQAHDSLSEDDQEIISLRFINELPFDLIAEILEVKENTARQRASRALDRLWVALERLGPSGLPRKKRRPHLRDTCPTLSPSHYT